MHLRGALSSKQATDKHWALKKSAQEYLQASLSKALNVSKDQIQVIVKSSGTNHVRAVLRLESPPGRSAALQDALSKEVEKGNVISLARQAVREDYLKKLAGMKLAALYMDAEFPASAASIWDRRSSSAARGSLVRRRGRGASAAKTDGVCLVAEDARFLAAVLSESTSLKVGL